MQNTQLLTISPDGVVTTLMMKPGQGMDLSFLGGHASHVRSSLVEWDESQQGWYVRFLHGRCQDRILSLSLLDELHVLHLYEQIGTLPHRIHQDLRETILFGEYDQAVKAEIIFIQGVREQHGLTVC